MNGYDIYCFCRMMQGRNKPSLEVYLESKEKNYFEAVYEKFIKTLKLDVSSIYDYIKVNFEFNGANFNIYDLLDESCNEVYLNWKRTNSTKALYFDQVKRSFLFMQDFCINKNITFDNYKKKYAMRHIREHNIDYCVAYYLKLVDKDNLSSIEKIVLKKYLAQYNIIRHRICNTELKDLLNQLNSEMINLFKYFKLM